jgi:hypothetical protein|tara:strand:+ start:635 stop:775 length:141 start_codon:yes stop_codon:yes gene_type:complete
MSATISSVPKGEDSATESTTCKPWAIYNAVELEFYMTEESESITLE